MSTRGSELEKKAEKVNLKLRIDQEAVILKVPTPMQITNQGLIPMQSTVDYVGIIDGGKFIAYDAKQTNVKTRFDLSNIHSHQLEYLDYVRRLGGITFFLMWMKKANPNNVYIVPTGLVNYYWHKADRQSLPIDVLNKESKIIKLDNYLEFLNDKEFYDRLFEEFIEPG